MDGDRLPRRVLTIGLYLTPASQKDPVVQKMGKYKSDQKIRCNPKKLSQNPK